jgi:hypothetical protein
MTQGMVSFYKAQKQEKQTKKKPLFSDTYPCDKNFGKIME